MGKHSILKIAHRGASGYAPENTLAAIEKAITMQADMVELDVMRCKSGEMIIIHDETVDRTTGGKGRVADLTLRELKKLDAGNGQTISTLNEVLDFIDCRSKVNLDLKGNDIAADIVKILGSLVKDTSWCFDDILLSAVDYQQLIGLKGGEPRLLLGTIVYKPLNEDFWQHSKAIGAYSVHPSIEILNDGLVSRAHKEGLKVFAWTANEQSDIRKAMGFGVDGIFSNFPDLVR